MNARTGLHRCSSPPAPMALAGKRVLVLGLGDTGLSVAHWVAREGGRVRVADSRAAPPAE